MPVLKTQVPPSTTATLRYTAEKALRLESVVMCCPSSDVVLQSVQVGIHYVHSPSGYARAPALFEKQDLIVTVYNRSNTKTHEAAVSIVLAEFSESTPLLLLCSCRCAACSLPQAGARAHCRAGESERFGYCPPHPQIVRAKS